jgi:hypothetical protein
MTSTAPPTRTALAALVAVTLAVLGTVVALFGATSAEAHTGAVQGVATCEDDGTFTVQWTYSATNVPDGKEAETKAMTTSAGHLTPGPDGVDKGGQVFLSVWTEHQVNVPGAPVRTGNWSAGFRTVGIRSGTSSVTTMVQTDWKDGPSEDPVGQVDLPDDCDGPTETPTPSDTPTPTPTPTPTTPTPTEPTPTEPTSPPTITPPTTEPPTEPPTTDTPPVRAESHCIGNSLVTTEQTYQDGEWVNTSHSSVEGARECRTASGEPPVVEEGM